MMNPNDKKPVQFYFALPRAVSLLFGGNAIRSESNGFEATVVGLWIYAIHYLFVTTKLIPLLSTRLLTPFLLIVAAFLVWLAWLLVIYVGSLIIKLLRLFGLVRNLPVRRAQMILLGIITTIMAGDVLMSQAWLWQLSILWLFAVVLNLITGLVLSFTDAAHTFDEE